LFHRSSFSSEMLAFDCVSKSHSTREHDHLEPRRARCGACSLKPRELRRADTAVPRHRLPHLRRFEPPQLPGGRLALRWARPVRVGAHVVRVENDEAKAGVIKKL
jgi:hypothetical protein